MPHIIVMAEGEAHQDGAMLLRERISIDDLASGHFGAQLLERLQWAVGDAHELERAVGEDPGGTEPGGPDLPGGDRTLITGRPRRRTRRAPGQPDASVVTTAS